MKFLNLKDRLSKSLLVFELKEQVVKQQMDDMWIYVIMMIIWMSQFDLEKWKWLLLRASPS